MCQGEENRLFVKSSRDTVLELETSTTTFTKLKTINIGSTVMRYGLCYVPDPHRLLVFSDDKVVRAVSCDDDTIVWKVKHANDPGCSLYIPSHNTILVADWMKNRVVILYPDRRLEMQSITLPGYEGKIKWLYLLNDQIIVGDQEFLENKSTISYFSVK